MCSLMRPHHEPHQFAIADRLPFVAAPAGEQAVQLRDLEIQVLVTGLLAETTQTMRFYNPNCRVLEGNLTFPFPDGAAVCGYALDVEGTMIDGVVVPKQEARRILEAEERKGVDPGILEQVQGNVYRTRLYPIPAQGTRTVRITYVSDLTVAGNDAAYHLPLGHAGEIDSVSLRIEVAQAPVTPEVRGGVGNLILNRWQDRWVAEAKLGKAMPAEDLQVRLPGLPDHVTAVEKNASGELFFCISSRLPDTGNEVEQWIPRRLAIAWDASGSRDDITRDLALLAELCKAWPELIVDVLLFRDCIDGDVKTFSIGRGEAPSLQSYLKSLPYDGGTNLAALDFSSLPHADDEAWLLFSDGLGTIGQGLPAIKEKRIVAISGRAACNSALLSHIARESGGLFVNLLRTTAEAARQAMERMQNAWKVDESAGCSDLHISSDASRLTITGRLDGSSGRVRMSGKGAPSGSLGVNADSATPGRLIARAWAGREAQKIALIEGEHSPLVLALGRTYGLVTPGTSLLVLESLDQYLEYNIEPPSTLPALVSEFRARGAQQAAEEKERKAKQIDYVLDLWKKRIDWWERDFLAEREKAKKMRPVMAREEGLVVGSGMGPGMGMPLGLSMSSPSPMMEPMAGAPPEAPALMMSAECCEAEAPCDGFSQQGADPGREASPRSAQAAITIKPWQADTPYLAAIINGAPGQAYRVYLEQRPHYATSPAFYFDCSDYFLTHQERPLGLRILSNLLELSFDDAPLMRMYAWRLQQAGELDLAISILERIHSQRADEPQSYRDLGLALGLRGESLGSSEDIIRAMELFYEVIMRQWDRFPEIEIIALMELNRLIHLARKKQMGVPEGFDRRLERHLDLDIRISMSWDADLTDVDLHVFEPEGEHAYYGHNLTEIGGLVSRDFRDGYGPEEYVLRKALPGVYTIKAHYYGSTQQSLTGPCTVTATVFTNYGRADEKKQVLMLRLDRPSDQVLVGEITIGGGAGQGGTHDDREDWQASFRALKRGMTINEITAIVGHPVEIRGEAEVILVYEPLPGTTIHVRTSPRLVAVQRVMEGAVLDML
jgi:Ca-activated chloride channel homolog